METLKSYGVITIFPDTPRQYLIVQSGRHGHWGFAKGGMEENETQQETALRELFEETGLKLSKLIQDFKISDSYTVKSEDRKKEVTFFIGVSDTKNVKIDNNEISDIKWLSFENALDKLTYESSREILRKVNKYLDENTVN